MKGSLKLGKIAGIGIFIHWTFAILLAFIIFNNYRQGQNAEQIFWSVIFILSIFATVFLHELGHALAAKRYNVITTDITLLPIGGVANLERIPEKPIEELVVALAGPAVNIILAIITGLFIHIPNMQTLSARLAGGVDAGNFFLNFFIVNIWLAIFNLIPAFPMDGGRVLRALLAMKMQRYIATRIAARIGQFLALGFIFVGFYSNPFLIFIGIFIMIGAQTEADMTKTGFMLKGAYVKDVVMKNYESIDENENIDYAVKLLLNGEGKNFLITSNNQPVGTLNRDEIIRALSNDDTQPTLIRSVMNKNILRLDANISIEKAYTAMLAKNITMTPVYNGQDFLGILDLENIFEFIMVKEAMNKHGKISVT